MENEEKADKMLYVRVIAGGIFFISLFFDHWKLSVFLLFIVTQLYISDRKETSNIIEETEIYDK